MSPGHCIAQQEHLKGSCQAGTVPTANVVCMIFIARLLLIHHAPGVQGTHGKDCQAIYQPAAAAEQRLAALLKQQQIVAQHQDSTADRAAERTAASTSSSTGGSTSTSDQGPPATGMPSQQQLTAADQLHAVSPAAKDLVRDILQEDNRQRTKQLVDDAWQTLE